MTYQTTKWDLSDLFPAHDSQKMKDAFKELESRVAEFEGLRDTLDAGMDPEDFLDTVQKIEENTHIAQRIEAYAGLWFAAETQNQDAQTFVAKVDQFIAELQNKTLFFTLWFKSLSDEEAQRFIDVGLDYEYWLQQVRNFKPYTLSEPEEKIINIKNVTGINALRVLYDSITTKLSYNVEVDGEMKELTRGELMTLVYRPEPELRAAAYQELYRVFGEHGPVLGQIYQTIVRDYGNENVKLRSFKAPISARNLVNDVPDEVVDVLLNVSQKNAPLVQRFFKLKAKLLGVEKIRRYDIYAPVAEASKTYDFDYAANITFDAFKDFDPKLAKLAKRVFDDNHIDSEVRKGKDTGAFCATVAPDLTPYVLCNFNGTARDIGTLAHELGHGIHAMMAEHHNIFNQHSSLPLAETASTFSEMLLIDRLLSEETDEDVQRDILFAQVDDAYATIMRQIFFALFEREAHKMINNGASVDELADAYMENLKTQFGDSLELSDEFRWEWVSIPHIYQVPFYVYAYAFGQLLVFALYQQYRQEGEAFKPRYLELLASGGSKPPAQILSDAGFDFTQESFWQGGYNVLAEMIDKLEEITSK